jgi:hypothetical protein
MLKILFCTLSRSRRVGGRIWVAAQAQIRELARAGAGLPPSQETAPRGCGGGRRGGRRGSAASPPHGDPRRSGRREPGQPLLGPVWRGPHGPHLPRLPGAPWGQQRVSGRKQRRPLHLFLVTQARGLLYLCPHPQLEIPHRLEELIFSGIWELWQSWYCKILQIPADLF